ncbi:hypothetical protein [Novosphingobium sp. MBES04]|uniref:hypothetical protein n=1 Tax=Novosphingobium sp. MBES04 TaxID=1206458 RepID=UPI0030EDC853
MTRARSMVLALLGAVCGGALLATSVSARESLGLYGDWGVFRDPVVPRCYAIAKAAPSQLWRDYEPFAAIGTWPKRGQRNQLHFRVSRAMAKDSAISLRVGSERFRLIGGGGDAWPVDDAENAAIIAAMRAAPHMTLSATGAKGGRFSNTWELQGAASAIDSALLGCARLR